MSLMLINLAKRLLAALLIFSFFIYITVFITAIPRNYTIKKLEEKWTATYTVKDLFTRANNKLTALAQGDYKLTAQGKDSVLLMKNAFKRSIKLLAGSLLIAVILGIIKGIFDSRRSSSRDSSFKVLLTIIPVSLPDVLIVAMLQASAIWLIKNGIKIFKVAGAGTWQHELLPIIALSILPACYIARVAAMSIESCYDKEYIRTAIGKGCSSRRILWNHVMRNSITIIFESLSNITSMIISNMMIVEYMFSYPGITSMLFSSYKNNDVNITILSIIVLGVIYFTLDSLFQFVKQFVVRPLKEEGI